jgi:hypothetical protein
VKLKCHSLQFLIILCTIISILLKSTKVLYHPQTCRVSEKSLSSCPKQAYTQDGGNGRKWLLGCSPHPNRNFKSIDFVDTIISKYFSHLPFSRNQPLQSTDDWHNEILKNKIINLGRLQKTVVRLCDLNQVNQSWNMQLYLNVYICSCKAPPYYHIYDNFYSTIFKMKNINFI